MSHVLDNMIWHAITTGNSNIATVKDGVGVYREDIAPFAGIETLNEDSFDKLYNLIPAGRRIAVAYDDELDLDETRWEPMRHMDVTQMVCDDLPKVFTTANSELILPLTDEHIPQMLELTALTKPGPFFQNTILFGNYFGIFVDGRLAAMAGQRMHPLPYMEVSAVCSHPDFRGKGYAKAVMLHVMKIIAENGFIPFLHVLTENAGAIKLYESIGYSTRKRFSIDMIRKR
ncbi:MAG TPA: GNAT family N-acetyltransferase [Chitinophagaceae bacterium]|nr:GNAT family N-acetyltransferase [Chitinophagales bacterium]HPG12772.1 GNAT family N-acetyltransferase [Chitinophagaceae bacterium]